jgi:hypothetical protein
MHAHSNVDTPSRKDDKKRLGHEDLWCKVIDDIMMY